MLLTQPQHRRHRVPYRLTVIQRPQLTHPHPIVESLLIPSRHFPRQPRLADPAHPHQRDQRPGPQRRHRLRQFPLMTHETRRPPQQLRMRPITDHRAHRHDVHSDRRLAAITGLAGQDLLMNAGQRRAGLHAEFLDQAQPGAPVGFQGIALAPTPVLRHHQLRSQPFIQRVPRLRRGQLHQQLTMTARLQPHVIAIQLYGKPFRAHRTSHLVHPRRVQEHERLTRPNAQRLLEQRRSHHRIRACARSRRHIAKPMQVN